MKIAFHAINGVGLGHLARMTAIAEEVRALHPDAQLLVLTNAADTTMLTKARLDFVRFPPRLAEPHADPDRVRRALPSSFEHAAVGAAIETFAPDLMIFDTHAPETLVQRASAVGARVVLVLRELRPAVLRAFVAKGLASAFDRIIVPHEPGEVDLSGTEHLPITVVGPIVRSLDTRLDRNVRAPMVLVMAGGGGQPVDARRFLRAAADAHILARARIKKLTTWIVAGPYASIAPELQNIDGLTVTGARDDLPGLLARAEVVVSQAGYNSIAEIRTLRRPAILVAGRRKSEDQKLRAKRLAKTGAAVLAKADPRSIANHLETLLLSPTKRAAMIRAHERHPIVAANCAAAVEALRPIRAAITPKRVVLIAHELPPRVGGMETVANTLAASLHASGVDVHVYGTKHFGPEPLDLPKGAVRRLYASGIDLWGDLLITIDALRTDAPDVIHLCNAGLAPWVPALKAAFPAAITVHAHGNDLLAPWVRHGGDVAAYRSAQRTGLASADAVLAVSAFTGCLLDVVGAHGAKIDVMPNTVDARRFSPGPRSSSLAERLGIAKDDEVILTVSRLVPRKGHAAALRMLAQILRERPKALYVYTGESAQLSAELTTLAKELGVASRVRAAGVVSEEELPDLYRLARAFVLLSEESATDVEGFGVALLEAAATGLPVLATRTGGMPEALVEEKTGLLVSPGDASSAAKAIVNLLQFPRRAKAMGKAGRERALRHFSASARTKEIVERWKMSLQKASGPRPLRNFANAFEGATDDAETPRARASRASLATAENGAALLRLAKEDATRRHEASARRRASFEKIVRGGGTVRLRAMERGFSLLVDALVDCSAIGHQPYVEMKLRRFVAPDFVTNALPAIRGARLMQVVPAEDSKLLFEKLERLPAHAFAKITSVRLLLSRTAESSPRAAVDAVPYANAFVHFFRARGIDVVPPEEIARYLTVAPTSLPPTGMIEPTNICNLGCPTCPTGKGLIKPKPQMSVERFDEVVTALTPPLATLALWNYGEPLLHRDLPSIIRSAKAAGVRVVKVSSNAHFLDGEKGRKLLKSGLDVLILCVDGASEETYSVFRKGGSFAKVAKQIAGLCAKKKELGLERPHIDVQFIVMRHNEHELDEIRRLCAEWGVDHLRIKTVGAEDDQTRHLIPKQKLLSRYREDFSHNASHPFCTMPWDHTVVNVDGAVTPCCYLRPDMGEKFIMGNVFETPFADIWKGEKYRAFRAAMLEGRSKMPVCDRCRGGTHDLFAAIEEVAAQ